jgi:hypothetical protein
MQQGLTWPSINIRLCSLQGERVLPASASNTRLAEYRFTAQIHPRFNKILISVLFLSGSHFVLGQCVSWHCNNKTTQCYGLHTLHVLHIYLYVWISLSFQGSHKNEPHSVWLETRIEIVTTQTTLVRRGISASRHFWRVYVIHYRNV